MVVAEVFLVRLDKGVGGEDGSADEGDGVAEG